MQTLAVPASIARLAAEADLALATLTEAADADLVRATYQQPTAFLPGTAGRMAVYRARASRREPIKNPRDADFASLAERVEFESRDQCCLRSPQEAPHVEPLAV